MLATRIRYLHRFDLWILPLATLLILGLTVFTFATTHALWPRLLLLLTLSWWLPGLLILIAWRIPGIDWITAGVLALALGACWMMLVALLVHWWPGPVDLWPMLAAYSAGALLLLLTAVRRQPWLALTRPTPALWRGMLVLLVLAALLRFPGLGYRELHSDETELLYAARNAVQGHDDAFARHTKGPGELAISLVLYRGLGTLNETTGRFSYALAGVVAVLAVALLGARLFSPLTGFWAGILFILNGYVLALSRLIQYHSFVLLLMALVILAGWEYVQTSNRKWLIVLAVFTGFAFVLHYEFVLVMPAVLLLWWRAWQRSPRWETVRTTVVVGLVAAIPPAYSYARLLLHPDFSDRTGAGWKIRFGQLGAFNVPFFIDLSTLYNSTYYGAGLLLLVIIGVILCWRYARDRAELLVLWFLPFLILYLFVLRFPGTHFYMMMESWSLLAAVPLARLTAPGRIRPAYRWGVAAVVVGWLALSTGYLYLAYFREDPEYVMNYARERNALYWAPYGEDIPHAWRFGFPILAGWKVLGVLNEWYYLGDTYTASDQSAHLRWYLGGWERVSLADNPDYIFTTTQAREPDAHVSPERLEAYQPIGEVRVRGEPRITIWSTEPPGPAPFVSYDLERFTTVFDGVVPSFREWPNPGARVQDVSLSETITLLSAGFSPDDASPGDTLHLYLRWRPEAQLANDYKLFVHVGTDDTGQPLAQWDGYPGLNTGRTSEWPAGDVFDDHVLLGVPESMPTGRHIIRVGLYDETTGERVGDRVVEIGTVIVR